MLQLLSDSKAQLVLLHSSSRLRCWSRQSCRRCYKPHPVLVSGRSRQSCVRVTDYARPYCRNLHKGGAARILATLDTEAVFISRVVRPREIDLRAGCCSCCQTRRRSWCCCIRRCTCGVGVGRVATTVISTHPILVSGRSCQSCVRVTGYVRPYCRDLHKGGAARILATLDTEAIFISRLSAHERLICVLDAAIAVRLEGAAGAVAFVVAVAVLE